MMQPNNYSEKELAVFHGVDTLLRSGADISTLKVADIATAAGIGKGTVYEYFSSKEDILCRAISYGLQHWLEDVTRAVYPARRFSEKFAALLESISQNAASWRLLLRAQQLPPLSPTHKSLQTELIESLLNNILEAAIAEGMLPASERSYGRQTIVCILAGFAVLHISGLALQEQDEAQQNVLRMAEQALRGGANV